MNRDSIAHILRQLYERSTTPEAALEQFRHFPYANLGFATIDHHRALRKGFPEVVYCEGKSIGQIEGIVRHLLDSGSDVLATRVDHEAAERIAAIEPAAGAREVYDGLIRDYVVCEKEVTDLR